jgi:hypothetical protein
MMNEIPLQTKKGFVDLVFGIYENDVKVVCDALDEVRAIITHLIILCMNT